MSAQKIAKILQAASFAAKKHTGQKRKDGVEPYINHPLEVANLLANVGQVTDEDILTAAILHDVLEDTDTTAGEITNLFGKAVCDYVLELTDDKSLPKQERKKLQIEKALHLSLGAKQIKIADKISNVHDIMNSPPKDWSAERKLEYIEWAKAVVERLRGVNEHLESYFDKLVKQAQESIEKTSVK